MLSFSSLFSISDSQWMEKRCEYQFQHYQDKGYLDTDAIVVSYPKCGRGWVNEMLLNYFAIISDIDPHEIKDAYQLSSLMESRQLPTFSFTHDFDPHRKHFGEIRCHIEAYDGRRVVFLMRDPRDIVVSWHYHKNYRMARGKAACDQTVYQTFCDDVGGLESVIRFMEQWMQNLDQRKADDFFRYEDLIEAPATTFTSILKAVGVVDVDAHALDLAIEAASFQTMRKKEELGQYRKFFRKVDLNGDPKKYKTRNGRVGSYKDELAEDQITAVENRYGERLRALGY